MSLIDGGEADKGVAVKRPTTTAGSGLFAAVAMNRKNARNLRKLIADPKADPELVALAKVLLRAYEERRDHER